MMPNKSLFVIILFVLFSMGAKAQNLTSSPSSIYGLGDLELGEYGRNAAMSGIGIGYRANDFINSVNPAGLSAIDSISFFFDLSLGEDYRKYNYLGKSQISSSANFRKIAFGFRASPKWSLSVGLIPYTSVGYRIDTKQYTEGTDTFTTANFTGSGGLNKYFWSNSYKITPKLSVGATVSIIAGTITHTQTQAGWTIEKTNKAAQFYADFGMQYSDRLSDNVAYTIGAVYGYQSKLPIDNHILVTNDSKVTIQDQTLTTKDQYIPESLGGGTSFTWKQKLTIAGDYRFQKWSALSTNYTAVKYTDMHKGTLAFEYIPDRYLPKTYWQIMRYRAGFTLSNSYLTTNNINPVNFSASAGLGFPLKTGSVINLSFEYGQSASKNASTFKESYARFTLSFSLRETWFLKSKFD